MGRLHYVVQGAEADKRNVVVWPFPGPQAYKELCAPGSHYNGKLLKYFMACLKGEQRVRRPWWAPSCISIVFMKTAKRNRQCRVVSLKLEP
ncbi:hypothetical protein KY284_011366 [Solanum tuberosum]|nr:hypothetical protein KY284_011366 [Solanum tuberosum]